MPALKAILKAVGETQRLEGFRCAAVQHLFPSTALLLESLADCGLSKSESVVLGKPYSTCTDAYLQLLSKGWKASPLSFRYLEDDIDLAPAEIVLGALFKGVDPKAPGDARFLLLDDGGSLVHALHTKFAPYAHLCVAVEQTERGLQIVRKMQSEGVPLACPVVSVGGCSAKKQWEAPIVGESVVDCLERALLKAGLPEKKTKNKEVCILGYGAVGRATASALRKRNHSVYVYDPDPEKMRLAAADGCHVGCDPAVPAVDVPQLETDPLEPCSLPPSVRKDPRRKEALSHGQIVISCTGLGGLSHNDYTDGTLPNGAILVNAASNNKELGSFLQGPSPLSPVTDVPAPERRTSLRAHNQDRFDGCVVDLGEQRDLMSHRIVRTCAGEYLVLCSGSVANLTEDSPPEFIQLTRALLLAACLQAVTEKEPGLHDLDSSWQRLVVGEVRADLEKRHLSLEAPDFARAMRINAHNRPSIGVASVPRRLDDKCRSNLPWYSAVRQCKTDGDRLNFTRESIAAGNLTAAAWAELHIENPLYWLVARMMVDTEVYRLAVSNAKEVLGEEALQGTMRPGPKGIAYLARTGVPWLPLQPPANATRAASEKWSGLFKALSHQQVGAEVRGSLARNPYQGSDALYPSRDLPLQIRRMLFPPPFAVTADELVVHGLEGRWEIGPHGTPGLLLAATKDGDAAWKPDANRWSADPLPGSLNDLLTEITRFESVFVPVETGSQLAIAEPAPSRGDRVRVDGSIRGGIRGGNQTPVIELAQRDGEPPHIEIVDTPEASPRAQR